MKKLLHLIATPREEESRTLQISETFLSAFSQKYPNWIIDELNLAKESLPALSIKSVSGKYVLLEGKEIYGSLRETWAEILQHIDRFKTADLFLISTPMWNFSIPYMLKQYIDLIVMPKYLFRYREDGSVEGLVKDKKMIVITSRGGAYGGEMQGFDHQEPYLRMIFGFIGFKEIDFIRAEPMDMGEDLQKQKIEEAKEAAERYVAGLYV